MNKNKKKQIKLNNISVKLLKEIIKNEYHIIDGKKYKFIDCDYSDTYFDKNNKSRIGSKNTRCCILEEV